ncbi:putative periplasmic serine endoprotease DegP-like precursor [Marinomonas aquimarina]|uniref:Probable periplasmic serine endoprotease DegP-like n=1 Tax=Marinomonas aquimarina TaxID=295068 RepID=A0A1A8T7L3_9GAMM|nr:DegQ family serine endoprotease [Marinomonas aquimarina]SBS28260.1 putative periplasmic serine endoprotease DegP-like precursor [Marinomonas aquimarina]
MNRLLKRVSWISVTFMMLFSTLVNAANLPDFTELVEDSSPAVVNISTEQTTTSNARQLSPDARELNEFFRHFFGQQPFGQTPQQPRQQQRSSLGSGFIISQDGYVLTNNHVIEGADVIHVRLNDRREYEATLVGTDARTDLALLKIEAEDLPTVDMGDSDDLKAGQWVLAIGSPFGFDYTVTAGIVSALGRNLPSDNYVPFIQSDVAINPGNSGGPLFNLDGEVVGINSQIYTRSGGFMGVSFAIPSNVAMSVVQQLKKDGKVSRAWLGVLIQDVNRDLAESFGLERPHGALVSRVMPDSPAEKAGLEAGDIIMAFNGKTIEHSSELPYLVGQLGVDTDAKARVFRDGKERTLTITLAKRPDGNGMQQQQADENRLGMTVAPVPENVAERLNIEGGVMVQQILGGAAARNGLQQGDVITMLNGEIIDGVSGFNRIAQTLPANRSVPMRVIRDGYPMFIPFKIVE